MRLMTQAQMMEELQVTANTLWQWRKQGMPYVPLGTRAVRYNLHDVMGWLEDRKAAAGAVQRKEVTS